ncbi:hypothetical protein ABZP36_018504 [Zizania latifolia]
MPVSASRRTTTSHQSATAPAARALLPPQLPPIRPGFGDVEFNLAMDVRPGFLPVFRSGSCADIGPKLYMEDEHVCVDNLIECLTEHAVCIPVPGAFYGVG